METVALLQEILDEIKKFRKEGPPVPKRLLCTKCDVICSPGFHRAGDKCPGHPVEDITCDGELIED